MVSSPRAAEAEAIDAVLSAVRSHEQRLLHLSNAADGISQAGPSVLDGGITGDVDGVAALYAFTALARQ